MEESKGYISFRIFSGLTFSGKEEILALLLSAAERRCFRYKRITKYQLRKKKFENNNKNKNKNTIKNNKN